MCGSGPFSLRQTDGIMKHLLLILCCFCLCLTTAHADSCDKSFPDVFSEISPSVVRIFSVSVDPYGSIRRVHASTGTGLVIDAQGHVLTNAHVVHGASEIRVSYRDDDMRYAKIVGVDPISDLAVIWVDESEPYPQEVRFKSTGQLFVGEEVLAIGYPLGIGKTATRGIISAMERVVPLSTFSWMMPFIQTDAAISPGNSGGPLVNRCGEVIGINTLNLVAGQNINFAIPADLIQEYAPQLMKYGRIIRPWYGINGRIVSQQMAFSLNVRPGFLVETVEPGSPAEDVGLRGGTYPVMFGFNEYLLGGDVITMVNGEKLIDMGRVAAIARSFNVGDRVKIEYWRGNLRRTAEIVLPVRPILPGDARWLYRRGTK